MFKSPHTRVNLQSTDRQKSRHPERIWALPVTGWAQHAEKINRGEKSCDFFLNLGSKPSPDNRSKRTQRRPTGSDFSRVQVVRPVRLG